MSQVSCPNCNRVSAIPAEFLGKKVRCKGCGESFQATAPGTMVAAARAGTVVEGTGVKGKATAAGVRTTVDSPADAVEVTALLKEAPDPTGPSSLAWVLSLLAFFLPLAASGGFVALKWGKGTVGGDPPELCGVVEVGAKGVKYYYFEIFPSEQHGYDYRIIEDDSINTDAVAGLKEKGSFAPARLAETVKVVKAYCTKLEDEHKVAADHLFVVASSGLLAGLGKAGDPEVDEAIKANQGVLANAVKAATGKAVDFVTVDEEVALQFRGSVPMRHVETALFLDIGGGGTRGGYRENVGLIRKVEAPGVRGFRDAAKKQAKGAVTFEKACANLAQAELRAPIRKQVEDNEGLRVPDRVYLGGGVVWVMATTLKPSNRETFCQLTAGDIDNFYKLVRNDRKYLENYAVPGTLAEDQQKWLEGEVKRMRKNFPHEDLVAGSEILKALSAELDFADKKLTFSRQSHNGWVLGFALDKLRGRK